MTTTISVSGEDIPMLVGGAVAAVGALTNNNMLIAAGLGLMTAKSIIKSTPDAPAPEKA